MEKKYNAYWLLNDFNLLEDRLELIRVAKPEISTNFNEFLLNSGNTRMIDIWPKDVYIPIQGYIPVDLLICTPYIEAVSDAAKWVITKMAQEEIEFLPIRVYDENGNPYTKTNYWVINILTVIDAIDWVNTRWFSKTPPRKDDPNAQMDIIKPCLINSKIIGHNIFLIKVAEKVNRSIYLSYSLMNELTKEGCAVGMEFSPIKTT